MLCATVGGFVDLEPQGWTPVGTEQICFKEIGLTAYGKTKKIFIFLPRLIL